MSNGSPSAFLLWAVLASIFQVFLFIHIWLYDRFQCVRWDSGRQPGAFKRVMTYSYLGTLPLLVVFGVSMTVLKYKEGYAIVSKENGEFSILPRPYDMWEPDHKSWILPLFFVLSLSWALELITHLEELTFWLFLLHQGPNKRDWFRSWEFRVWYLGSMLAIIGMPLTVLLKRKDLELCLACVFVAGASAGTLTTICFIYVLARFPGLIKRVKSDGADPDIIVRLSTFYQLNIVRVTFRFFYTFPLLIFGADAVREPRPIASNDFASDFLLMAGGIGCFVSSAITLLIFFPRSITRESGYNARNPSPALPNKTPVAAPSPLPDYYHSSPSPKSPVLFDSHRPARHMYRHSSFRFPPPRPDSADSTSSRRRLSDGPATPIPQYERELGSCSPPPVGSMDDNTLHGEEPPATRQRASLEEEGMSPPSSMHPYVMNFTSPIDLWDQQDDGSPRAI